MPAIKFHKVAALPGALEADAVYFVQNNTFAETYLTNSAGVAALPGARTLEYNRQPAGMVNYMITLGSDGKMSALRQVLNPSNFAQVLPGMPMEQVRKMLGKPMKITPYALKRQTHYDWRYLNPPNTAMVFTVVFDHNLQVVSTASVVDDSAAS